jgi:adenylate cyclase, class 2
MIEIEKKYRLTKQQRANVLRRLPKIGANYEGTELEENTLYHGEGLNGASILRLRRVGRKAILTYKQRLPSTSSIKHQTENETRVSNAESMAEILDALGYTPALVYEKRRETWRLRKTEIVLDELPFGLYMEIEGSEQEIGKIERDLGIKGLRAEKATYPQLASKHGRRQGSLIESRFD